MTTAGNFYSTVARATCDVPVAGVPWPAYKLIALLVDIEHGQALCLSDF